MRLENPAFKAIDIGHFAAAWRRRERSTQ
jgi:hypothetical protein